MARKDGAQFQAQRRPDTRQGTEVLQRFLRASTLIPDAPEDPTIVLGRLEFQNPTLGTGSWKVYKGNKGNAEKTWGLGGSLS